MISKMSNTKSSSKPIKIIYWADPTQAHNSILNLTYSSKLQLTSSKSLMSAPQKVLFIKKNGIFLNFLSPKLKKHFFSPQKQVILIVTYNKYAEEQKHGYRIL